MNNEIKTWRQRMQDSGRSWINSVDPQELFKEAEIAELRAKVESLAADAERLDFMMDNDAFPVWTLRDGTIKQCQIFHQDEDEDFHVLSGPEDRYFNSPREAIDAAIAMAKEKA